MNLIFPSFNLSMSNAAALLSCYDGQGQVVEIQHPHRMFPLKDGPGNPTAGSAWFNGSTSGAARPVHCSEVNQQLKDQFSLLTQWGKYWFCLHCWEHEHRFQVECYSCPPVLPLTLGKGLCCLHYLLGQERAPEVLLGIAYVCRCG